MARSTLSRRVLNRVRRSTVVEDYATEFTHARAATSAAAADAVRWRFHPAVAAIHPRSSSVECALYAGEVLSRARHVKYVRANRRTRSQSTLRGGHAPIAWAACPVVWHGTSWACHILLNQLGFVVGVEIGMSDEEYAAS